MLLEPSDEVGFVARQSETALLEELLQIRDL